MPEKYTVCPEETCLSLWMMYVHSNVASLFPFLNLNRAKFDFVCMVVCFPDQWIARKTRGGSHYRKLKCIQGLCRGTRTFTVKKQFRGNRLMFYNLWDFMWRVFKVSILESFTFACIFKVACRGKHFVGPKDFFFFFFSQNEHFPFYTFYY